ncbi:MAG: PDZ domain-containing protein [Candidatus Saccharicenans sp.]|nr:PDZ domain-containing protein [Candidatus Saccharicenans sp.]MDI6848767.1 PDZ domain-containing protein [Candidatus Saccharicenans sp.]
MSNKKLRLFSICFFLLFLVTAVLAVNTQDTAMLNRPAVGPGRIAFVYAGNLWIADLEGKNPRQLTVEAEVVNMPVFSPDGKWIAFSAQRDGNIDVYLIPAEGGQSRRLTWHPGPDLVQDFGPCGKKIMFTSTQNATTRGASNLFMISVDGGFPEEIKIPYVYRAKVAPDGQLIAYNHFPDAFRQWKNYRGGRNSIIHIYDRKNNTVDKIPQPEGRCNDIDPIWGEDKLYFLSDRNGEFNLFSYDLKTREIKQLTNYTDFPIIDASGSKDRIIFEQAGRLHLFDPETGQSNRLVIGLSADLVELRERFAKGARWLRNADLSPSGARAVFEFRGEIITFPAEKGDYRNLTQTTGVHERNPVWSPDGKTIAYFSDESGEYELHLSSQDGKGPVKKFRLPGAGFYGSAVWSPDSQKIAFADNSLSLFWLDLRTGAVKKIASEYLYGPGRLSEMHAGWSPDSKWLTYTLNTQTYIQKVFVYSLEQDRSFAITDGLSEVAEPRFDAGGNYLYFLASTDAGPVKQWFDMSNADLRASYSIYLAVLKKDLPNPLAKESDEEKPAAEKKDHQEGAAQKPAGKTDKPVAAPARPEKAAGQSQGTVIDLEGLEYRIVALPIPPGNYSSLQTGEAGNLYYLEFPTLPIGAAFSPGSRSAKLHKFDLKSRKDEVIMEGLNNYLISADKKKILYVAQNTWGITNLSPKIQVGQGRINVDSIEVKINPVDEWKQIFYEAWRVNRDFFYDPNMHGCDWAAMKAKYEKFLPELSCRDDLNRLLTWMCSELAVGHHRGGGGDTPYERKTVRVGLLGADYEIANGRYRFQKVYGGLNWNPELRSPLTEPGVNVRAGEYLLAVEGKELVPPDNLFKHFENKADKIVEITVGPNPDGKGSRTVQVVPVADDFALRNRDWVEGNLKKVEEATGGRVAYVYVPNTSTQGYIYFRRYFFPQAYKEAIIVDERFNGGGSVADYYIDWLSKPFIAMWTMRYGADLKTPSASIQGPKVMLINEMAGSGGDLLPWMFRHFKLGPLVGKRTWGGLVGVLGFPVLMDGGSITAPNLAFWTEEEGFGVENVGVPPDIEVEITPADYAAGRDPQLEKAIEVIMEMLKKNPPKKMQRPPYPIRVRK